MNYTVCANQNRVENSKVKWHDSDFARFPRRSFDIFCQSSENKFMNEKSAILST